MVEGIVASAGGTKEASDGPARHIARPRDHWMLDYEL